jgi:hypothetical protein
MHRRCPAGRYVAAAAGSLTLAATLTGIAPADAAVAACRWTDTGQPPPMSTDGSFPSVAVPSATPGSSFDQLNGVRVVSAANAWAVGSGQDGPAFILQWDGHRWQPGPALVLNTNLNGVTASSGGNAWAVGDVSDGTATRPLTLHCT